MTAALVQGFLAAAERDIEAAERLLPNLSAAAVFHAQQAAEKLARALCIHAGLPDLRTHDIGRIAERLPEEHPFRAALTEMDRLSAAATIWRYPDSTGMLAEPPASSEVRTDLDQLCILHSKIQDMLRRP